jgi:hypothetical protein
LGPRCAVGVQEILCARQPMAGQIIPGRRAMRLGLCLSSCSEECVCGGMQKRAGLARRKDLRTHERAVDEQRQLTSQLVWAFDAEALGNALEAMAEFFLVCRSDAAGWMVDVRKFGRDVELRATSIVGTADALGDPIEVCIEFGGRIGRVEFGDAVPAAPEILVFTQEECGDEVVLGAEVAIEAGFGDAGFFDDQVNADGAHAALIEERGGGAEDAIAHFGGVAGGRVGVGGSGFFGHEVLRAGWSWGALDAVQTCL